MYSKTRKEGTDMIDNKYNGKNLKIGDRGLEKQINPGITDAEKKHDTGRESSMV